MTQEQPRLSGKGSLSGQPYSPEPTYILCLWSLSESHQLGLSICYILYFTKNLSWGAVLTLFPCAAYFYPLHSSLPGWQAPAAPAVRSTVQLAFPPSICQQHFPSTLKLGNAALGTIPSQLPESGRDSFVPTRWRKKEQENKKNKERKTEIKKEIGKSKNKKDLKDPNFYFKNIF